MKNLKLIIIIPVLLLITCISSYSQRSINLRTEITPEVAKEYDEYIKKYAPADSAYTVLISWANVHYYLRRSAVSMYLMELYKPYFPNKSQIIDNEIEKLVPIMISQSATPDMFSIYSSFIKKKAPSNDAYFAMQRITDYYIQRQLWDSAVYVYNTFKPLFPQYERLFNKTIKLLEAPIEGLQVENLGPNINTKGSEWDPTPTPDGRYLYFSADFRRGNHGNSDIWVSEKVDGIWQKSVNIEKPINGVRDETVDNVSVDGTGLLISGNFQGSYGAFDIYLAEKDSTGWRDIVHLPSPANSEYHDESACLSPDGKAILFTSDRPGGIGPFVPMTKQFYGGNIMGNMDIYVCLETDTGWSEPINLGPTINSAYSERAVYLHPDGKTLYFSSNGHYGLGRLDVFKSVRLSDTSWTEWSEPVNLGKEINSANDDWGYAVDIDGKTAYFAKENDINGYGGWDIYSITLPDAAKPQSLAVIRGQVTDSLGRAIACNIIWEDLSTGKQVGHLKSDPRDGFYFITLPLGKNYGYYAERSGFYPTSKNIDLRNIEQSTQINEDIILVSIKEMQDKGTKIRVNNIFFDFDKFELKAESIPELNRLYTFLQKIPKYRIIIEGHTDDSGSNNHNLTLSQNRASVVADFLIKKGISEKRIKTEGFGATKPNVPNTNDENRSLNRRVEIRLVR